MQAAELHSAFVFDCDNCGRENFVRAIEAQMDEATAKRVAADQCDIHYDTISDTTEGRVEAEYVISRVSVAPRMVQCGHCGHKYSVELWSDDQGVEP